MLTLTEIILRWRWPVLLCLLALTGLFVTAIPRLRIEASFQSLLDEDHPDLVFINDVLDEFGSAVPLVLAFQSDDLFTPENLHRIQRISKRLEEVPYVDWVLSLANAVVVRGTEDGVEVRSLFEEVPEHQAALERLRREVLSESALVGNLVSADGRTTAIIAELIYIPGEEDRYAIEVVNAVREIAREEIPRGMEHHLSGLTVIYREVVEYITQDLYVLTLAPTILIFFTLLIIFRSLHGVVLPFLVVNLTLVWTLGLMAALDIPITVTSTLLPPLILVIGCADAVHILIQAHEEFVAEPARVDGGRPAAHRHQCVVRAMGRVGYPCLMTSLTTMAGFVSLLVGEIVPMRHFGCFAAAGIAIAFIISVTLIPIALVYVRLPIKPTGRQTRTHTRGSVTRSSAARGGEASGSGGGLIARALALVEGINIRRRRTVLLVSAAACALALGGITRLKVESSLQEAFKSGSPILESIRFIEENLGGADYLDIIIRGEGEGSLLEPHVLKAIEEFEEFVRRQPEVDRASSVVDILARMHRVLGGGIRAGLPDSRQLAAQYLLLFSDESDIGRLINSDHSRTRLAVRVKSMPSSESRELVKRLEGHLGGMRAAGLEVRMSGPVFIFQKLVHSITWSQIKSFSLAFFIIFLMMWAIFRRLRLALLSMIPNLTPIAVMLGIMGWGGIRLNDVTIMIAGVSIGIAVDDTIHYLTRFRRELAADGDYHTAMSRTLQSVGHAIAATSVILAAGFLVALASHFKPPVYFGLLSSTTIVVALLADLLLLPVCLALVRPIKPTREPARNRS